MKILFLAHRTPYPPNKGDKIRSYHILSHLAQKHVVSLAYWVDDTKDIDHTTVFGRLCRGKIVPVALGARQAKARALWSLARGGSFSEGYYYSEQFQKVVEAIVNETDPDLMYVFSSAMARYAERFPHIPRIVDFVDVDSDKWGQLSQFARFPLSQLYRLEKKRLARFEVAVSCWARISLFVSQIEADLFRDMGGQGSVAILPNGVGAGIRQFPSREQPCPRQTGILADPKRAVTLLFVGTMNYYPNADAVLYFTRDILPLIRKRFPQAVFQIVGRFPPAAVRKLNGRNGVRVLGEVDEIYSYLVQADVSVAPMRMARGVQNKVLEAMSIGVPVVATSEAVQGIRVSNGHEVLVADNPESFATQVIRLLTESELRNCVTRRALQKVREEYNWRAVGRQLDALIENVGAGVSKASRRMS